MTQKLTATLRAGAAGAALIGLAACASGLHNPLASAAPPPAVATAPAMPTAPVAPATIKDVQNALQQAGYYKNDTVDGLWGRHTERAVRRFQHDHQLTANGQLDIPTMRALNLTGNPPSTSNNPSAGNGPENAPANTSGNRQGNEPANAPPAASTAPPPSANPGDQNAPAGANGTGTAQPTH